MNDYAQKMWQSESDRTKHRVKRGRIYFWIFAGAIFIAAAAYLARPYLAL